MDWLYNLFIEPSALQAVVILSLICAIGLGLGKIRIGGISLGVTFVFFAGILAGHLGLKIDPQMLNYAESFGLVIFVYALGLQVGPGFFSSFRDEGVRLNMLGIGVVLIGTFMAVAGCWLTGISLPDMAGILRQHAGFGLCCHLSLGSNRRHIGNPCHPQADGKGQRFGNIGKG